MTDESLAEAVEVESAPQDEQVLVVEENIEVPLEDAPQAIETVETGEKDPAILDTDSKGVQDRINKVIKQRYTAQDETKAVKQQLEDALARLATFKKEPSLDDADINHDPVVYKEKLTEYINEQNSNTTPADSQADTAKADRVSAFSTKLDAFKVEAPDYAAVVGSMPIGQDASDAILEVDNGPAVAYYLGSHLDKLDEINQLQPIAAALRISELSRSLQPAQPKQTQAPDPVTSVSTGGGTTTKNTDDMSMDELADYDARVFAANNG